MKKISTLFVRDFDHDNGRYVIPNQVTPGCEWVLAGEGTATRKYDGTCVALKGTDDPFWVARREVKRGKQAPEGFWAIDYDDVTGKSVGWEPIEESGFHRWFVEAESTGGPFEPGTYELCGPKINGNPEKFEQHRLIRHADAERYPAMNRPLGYDELATAFGSLPWEGIVWHHPDGRMVKLKARDLRAVSVQGAQDGAHKQGEQQ